MQKQSDWKSKICRIVIEKLIGLNYNDEEPIILMIYKNRMERIWKERITDQD